MVLVGMGVVVVGICTVLVGIGVVVVVKGTDTFIVLELIFEIGVGMLKISCPIWGSIMGREAKSTFFSVMG